MHEELTNVQSYAEGMGVRLHVQEWNPSDFNSASRDFKLEGTQEEVGDGVGSRSIPLILNA